MHENPIMSVCWVDIVISVLVGLLYLLLIHVHPNCKLS
jgi:hypothetical protein